VADSKHGFKSRAEDPVLLPTVIRLETGSLSSRSQLVPTPSAGKPPGCADDSGGARL